MQQVRISAEPKSTYRIQLMSGPPCFPCCSYKGRVSCTIILVDRFTSMCVGFIVARDLSLNVSQSVLWLFGSGSKGSSHKVGPNFSWPFPKQVQFSQEVQNFCAVQAVLCKHVLSVWSCISTRWV